MSILNAIFTLFCLVLNPSLANIMKCQGFHTYLVQTLLLSSECGTVTSSSLCILCTHVSCWVADHTHTLELQHTTFKWFCFLHTPHIFPNARHWLWSCAVQKYLQLSILSLILLFFGLLLVISASSLASMYVIIALYIFCFI